MWNKLLLAQSLHNFFIFVKLVENARNETTPGEFKPALTEFNSSKNKKKKRTRTGNKAL
jgi:hypothetical protein